MSNTEISNNNPEKELIIGKPILDDKTQKISKKNTTQNKKIAPKNNKSNKSFDEISNEIFRDLVCKKDSLIKEKSISDDKTKQISKKNITPNKKTTPNNDKLTKSFDEISNEIFRDLVSKKDSLVKEIKEL